MGWASNCTTTSWALLLALGAGAGAGAFVGGDPPLHGGGTTTRLAGSRKEPRARAEAKASADGRAAGVGARRRAYAAALLSLPDLATLPHRIDETVLEDEAHNPQLLALADEACFRPSSGTLSCATS